MDYIKKKLKRKRIIMMLKKLKINNKSSIINKRIKMLLKTNYNKLFKKFNR